MDEPEERSESHGAVGGAGISHRTFNPGFAGSNPVGATKFQGRADYCPGLGGHVHFYINMIYWGHRHPFCACCHYEDVTRLVE